MGCHRCVPFGAPGVTPLDERPLGIDSGGFVLEAMLHEGAGALAALVLHPHPQFGGTMDSHVVTGLCEELAGLGATTLRFNFRGTGRSEGSFTAGTGQVEDTRAAATTLRALAPDARLLLAGYSFGAAVAASVAAELAPAALVLVAPPVLMMPVAEPPQEMPALLITGENDPVAPAAQLQPIAGPHHLVVVVAGVDHTWWPGREELLREVRAFVASL